MSLDSITLHKKTPRAVISSLIDRLVSLRLAWSGQQGKDDGWQRGPAFPVFFVGAQGVGKTTLEKEVVSVSRNEARLIRGGKRLNPRGRDWHLGEKEMPRIYETLLEMRLRAVCEEIQRTPHAKFRNLYYLYQVVTNHVWLRSQTIPGVTLIDSSLFQHFATEICALQRTDPGGFFELVSNSLFVHCVANDIAVILGYIETRNRDGLKIASHWGKNDEELEVFTRTRIAEIARFVNCVREVGVPCLEIDTAGDIDTNAHKVWSFIQAETFDRGLLNPRKLSD